MFCSSLFHHFANPQNLEKMALVITFYFPYNVMLEIQGDTKLLSVFPLPINGHPDNNLESLCIILSDNHLMTAHGAHRIAYRSSGKV
jgi:hypothetical protein